MSYSRLKGARLPRNSQCPGSVHCSPGSVRPCPEVTAHFLTIYELNGKCNVCQSPNIQQWSNTGMPGGGKNHLLRKRGRKSSLGRDPCSGCWSKHVSDPKAAEAWLAQKTSVPGSQPTFTAQATPKDQAYTSSDVSNPGVASSIRLSS